MDKTLLLQYLQHFSQAQGTPFTIDSIISKFGDYAEKETGRQFKEGTLDIDKPEVDKITKEFLKELQRTLDDPPEINTIISREDIKRNYKRWNKNTSTSPSRRYLGLYKTWITIPEEKEDEYTGITSNEFFDMI
jgi:hypothetical protein